MDKNEVIEKVQTMIHVPYCDESLKQVGAHYIDVVGTKEEKEVAKQFITELEEDILTVEELISLGESEAGIAAFGEEGAKGIADHGKQLQSLGKRYCDCEACTIAEELLENKDIILG